MIVLMNWWYPYSKASIVSALQLGYKVHVIVSDSAYEGSGWLREKVEGAWWDKVTITRDYGRRDSKAAHTLTRFDFLPSVLANVHSDDLLVTDADVIFQKRSLYMPREYDVGLWQTEPRDMAEIDGYARSNHFPLWWSEMACTTMAEAMLFSPTPQALQFAHRIKLYADSLRSDGYADRWGVDQVAIKVAERRLNPNIVYPLNRDALHVATAPAADIWFPHPHEREDLESPWNQKRFSLLGEPPH